MQCSSAAACRYSMVMDFMYIPVPVPVVGLGKHENYVTYLVPLAELLPGASTRYQVSGSGIHSQTCCCPSPSIMYLYQIPGNWYMHCKMPV